mmetsp:Transcript_4271/g.12322  ORF Transcript_4271/g.12322 Transcript_4271/m.12322 type:complete len:224 (-) Transcript_4271:263-934(-)
MSVSAAMAGTRYHLYTSFTALASASQFCQRAGWSIARTRRARRASDSPSTSRRASGIGLPGSPGSRSLPSYTPGRRVARGRSAGALSATVHEVLTLEEVAVASKIVRVEAGTQGAASHPGRPFVEGAVLVQDERGFTRLARRAAGGHDLEVAQLLAAGVKELVDPANETFAPTVSVARGAGKGWLAHRGRGAQVNSAVEHARGTTRHSRRVGAHALTLPPTCR